jgi:hypothetical protein
LEDLTTALSRIESTSQTNDLWYAIPADPVASSWPKTIELDGSHVSINDDLSPYIGIALQDSLKRESMADFLLAATLDKLLNWRWEEAGALARECLRLSSVEPRRDEALNLLAASWLMLGEADRALSALKKSVEGQWNLALQTNLAIVATHEDPSLAIEQMSYLIAGAPDGVTKLEACRRAIRLWRTTQSEWTGSDDEDDFDPLPRPVLDSIHKVLCSPQIDEESLFELGCFLARTDGPWLISSGVIEQSPHNNSPTASLIKARADSLLAFMHELPVAEQRSGNSRPWITHELDAAIDAINASFVSDEPSGFASDIAFAYLEAGLDCSTFQRCAMRGFLVIEIVELFEDTNDEPNESFIDWISQAKKSIKKLSIEPEHLDFLNDLLGRAGNILALLFSSALTTEGVKVEELANSVHQRTSGLMNKITANYDQIRETSRLVDHWCLSAVEKCARLQKITVDRSIQTQLKELQAAIEHIRLRVEKYS